MSECILWNGKKRKDGRGYIHINKNMIDAHRYVYEKEKGKLDKGMMIKHTCKNKFCVKIEHLVIQTRITPIKDRLLRRIIVPNNENLCWIWTGGIDKNGYGNLDAYKQLKEKRAHRISYILYNGDFDRSLFVCHSCDNPKCVNPKHLWLGTTQDNTEDRKIKGRGSKSNYPIFYGEKNPKSKLTKDQVIEIRNLHKNGMKYSEIANLYPVSGENIRDICLFNTWKNID